MPRSSCLASPAPRFGILRYFFLPLCLVIYLMAGYAFAQRQTLWLDETTQLSGIPLGPVGVTQWLAGAPHDFGCPTAPDRMPPVSYWVGQIWTYVFGFSELSLRYMGVACVAGAIVLVYAAGRRAFGDLGGLAAGLYLAVSPARSWQSGFSEGSRHGWWICRGRIPKRTCLQPSRCARACRGVPDASVFWHPAFRPH